MCLITQEIKPTIAEQNIVCYKVVSEASILYYTPFMHMAISKSNKIIKPEPSTLRGSNPEKMPGGYKIGPGFIHAYKDTKRAYRALPGMTCKAILECIVPIGANFYVGDDNDICASELEIVKKV